jgi:tetratricopeptide (TPR) repeat protein
VLIVAVLVRADAGMFEKDAEFSSLYNATLQDAYSRFSASDKKVPAGGPVDEIGGNTMPQVSPAQMAGTRPAPGAAMGGQRPAGTMPMPGAAAPAGSGLNFKQQSEMAALRGNAGGVPAGVQPAAAQHVHDDGGPHSKRGNELLAQAKYDEAIAEFRLALQENPNRAQAQHSIGDALRYQGKHAEAIASYDAVLKQLPTFHCCYVHIGEILAAQGRSEEAQAAFNKAIEGYKQDLSAGGPQASVAAYHLAKLYVDQNRNIDEALVLAGQAVQAAPNQPAYLHLLARCNERAGRKEEAIKITDQILQLNPENIQIYQTYRNQLMGAPAQSVPPAAPPAPGSTP